MPNEKSDLENYLRGLAIVRPCRKSRTCYSWGCECPEGRADNARYMREYRARRRSL